MPARFSATTIPTFPCSFCGASIPFDDRCTCCDAVEAAELRLQELIAQAIEELRHSVADVFFRQCGEVQHALEKRGIVRVTPGCGKVRTVVSFVPAAALGCSRSPKKAASSRANGAKGGRPRTKPTDV